MIDQQNEHREAFTVKETMQKLNVSRSLIYKAIREGALPHRRLGDRILIPRVALNDWLNGTNPPTPLGGAPA